LRPIGSRRERRAIPILRPIRLAAASLSRGGNRLIGAVAAIGLVATTTGVVRAAPLTAGNGGMLDRVAFAVDGVESTHGADAMMWRSEFDGPQGPMQVSAAAAADVGGGDRFEMAENRMLGRAYLAHLYRRYANWPDAVAAYNWGPGNMDSWIGAGRPTDKFPVAVSLYRIRVLSTSTLPLGSSAMRFGRIRRPPRRPLADRRHPSRESLAVEQLYGAILADSKHIAH
jgi:hypothetical protein